MSRVEDLKGARVQALLDLPDTSFIRFKGACLMRYPHSHGYTAFEGEQFANIAYSQFGLGISRSSVADLAHAVETVARDLTPNARYIGFGDKTWDTQTLSWIDSLEECVYTSSVVPSTSSQDIAAVQQYLLAMADGDPDLAVDYLQMMAPLFMWERPVGIIWASGSGANGKSIYLEAFEMIIGKHLSNLTMEMIEDGRATPALRGVLGNVVSETSERRVEDTQKYKNIGAHEPFAVRVLGTHNVVTIDTNFHTVFSANNVPVFSDKTMGSRRRTLLVPFPATFKEVLGFKERTFTPGFLGALITLVLEQTHAVAERGYEWSKATRAVQLRYNAEANTAEAFARHLDELGVVAFKNYNSLRLHYEGWCGAEGTIPLGRTQLSRAIETVLKPERGTHTEDSIQKKYYYMNGNNNDTVVWLPNGYGTAIPNREVVLEQLGLEAKSEW